MKKLDCQFQKKKSFPVPHIYEKCKTVSFIISTFISLCELENSNWSDAGWDTVLHILSYFICLGGVNAMIERVALLFKTNTKNSMLLWCNFWVDVGQRNRKL